jgi:acetyl/propionyl-CoA carboxylase alpha subunit
LIKILQHPEFVEGKMTTQFIETHFKSGLPSSELDVDIRELAKKIEMANVVGAVTSPAAKMAEQSPWVIQKR